MRHLNSLLALAVFSFFLVSCTLDSDDTSLDLTAEISTSIKTQKANAAFDTSKEGIYHGIFTSGLSQSNGVVWINIGNDESYSAIVELSNGKEYDFELVNSTNDETNPTSYKFVNEVGSFVFDVSNPSSPLLKDATLNNLVHLGKIVKNTSQSRAMSKTGTFAGGLSGTWNLMYDETGTVPSGGEAKPLINVVVTWLGGDGPIMKTDVTFEAQVDCIFGIPTPYFGAPFAIQPKDMCANGQSSDFGGSGMTSWSIQHNATIGGGYISFPACAPAPNGTWSRAGGTITGTILID
jgi:hypothetical protein